MANDFENLAGSFLSGESGKKIGAKKSEIERLANTPDGKRVKEMLEQNGSIEKALADGDIETIKSAITSIMSTQSGARLAKQLGDLMK